MSSSLCTVVWTRLIDEVTPTIVAMQHWQPSISSLLCVMCQLQVLSDFSSAWWYSSLCIWSYLHLAPNRQSLCRVKAELALVVTLAEYCTAYLPNVPLGSFTNLLCIFYLSNSMAHRPVTHIMSMHGVLLKEHLSRHSRHSSVIMCESLDHSVPCVYWFVYC